MQDLTPLVTRRAFLETATATTLTAALAPNLFAAPTPLSAAETVVQEFYQSLTPSQRKEICFEFDHPLRKKISANWHVSSPTIGDDFYSDSQRATIRKIVAGMTSDEGHERLMRQLEDDDGGIEFYSVGLFGIPSDSQFQFELTGRHLTLRADGNSVEKAAFGGPIVYGHGEEGKPEDNIYFYQTQQTNKVFESLDSSQRKAALLKTAPKEAAILIQKENPQYPGIQVGSMAEDQKELVKVTLGVLLAPYREEDKAEVMQILDNTGGVDQLRMAFYQQGDLANDRVWDIWRIEGPQFVWHFRGAPHVHAYINIGSAF